VDEIIVTAQGVRNLKSLDDLGRDATCVWCAAAVT
jgi:hypothetical protein